MEDRALLLENPYRNVSTGQRLKELLTGSATMTKDQVSWIEPEFYLWLQLEPDETALDLHKDAFYDNEKFIEQKDERFWTNRAVDTHLVVPDPLPDQVMDRDVSYAYAVRDDGTVEVGAIFGSKLEFGLLSGGKKEPLGYHIGVFNNGIGPDDVRDGLDSYNPPGSILTDEEEIEAYLTQV